MSQILIKGGHLCDPSQSLDKKTDLYIQGGKITGIGDAPDGFKAGEIIQADDQLIIPGVVDLCARIREPGFEHKATIESETRAAARAGITTLCCPPDTLPVIDEPAVVELITQKTAQAEGCNVVTLAALTAGLKGEHLCEMQSLKNEGCVGASNARQPVFNTDVLKKAFAYAANCGLPVHIEPDDHWLSAGGCAHEGFIASRLGLKGIPVSAETVALARAIQLVAETGIQAHFGRLSSAESVNLIRRAKDDGLNISADVSAHQLHLTEHDISNLNSNCHVLPPLRSLRDQQALIQGIADGTIDAICSDHQPHQPDAKQAPFASSEAGISSLETLLPLVLKLVHSNALNLNTAVKALTSTPARILDLQAGTLAMNAIADICIVDLDTDWLCQPQDFNSAGKNNPFTGWNFQGHVKQVLIAGKPVITNQ